MRRPLLAATLMGVFFHCSAPAMAGEGMWVPQQLPEIAPALRKAGLKLDPQQLADLTGDPLGAVVSLGGCTASFVSNQGLVLTNHHCAYGAIQLNSTPENNLMRDGFNAEALGVSQANVDKQLASATVPDVRRLLGVEAKPGQGLGLPDDWVVRIIRHVGNYADSFERHLGEKSPLKLTRGLNALWNAGGILYAPPVR